MTTPIGLFSVGNQGKSPNLTAAHRLNLYLEVNQDADKTQVNAYGTPGLNLFASLSGSPSRGVHWMESNNKLYVVQRGTLWEVATDGTATNRGTLAVTPVQDISGYLSMANNGTQLCIVTGSRAYIFNTSTNVLTDITSSIPFASGSYSVTFLDSYFIIERPGTGQFWISAQYDGLTWGALNYATAESNPDNLIAVRADKGHLVLLGSSSTEFWVNTGAQAFPYQRVDGANSASGIEALWSIATCRNNITALVRNRQGAIAVAYLDGYQWTPISTPDIDYIFNNYTTPSDAVAFSYTINGRAFYQITFQTAQKSWLFDFTSGAWSQLKSWGISRYTGDIGAAFDTKFIVSDYATGQLYYLHPDAITDNGQPIERELVGKHFFRDSRNNSTIRRLRVDFEGGVGLLSGQGNDPQVMLQISRDNGHTWGREMWKRLGKLGEYQQRAEWRRLGQARDWVFKLRITDPVKVVIINAIVEGQELAK